MAYRLLFLCIVFPFLAFSQELSKEELFEMQLPSIFRSNLNLFAKHDYYEKYKVSEMPVSYFKDFDSISITPDDITYDIAAIEYLVPGTNKRSQTIEFTFKFDMAENISSIKTKVLKHTLTDRKNNRIALYDSILRSRGGGSNYGENYITKLHQLIFKNLGKDHIKGDIDIQFKFLTGYRQYKIDSIPKDSLLPIEGKKIKILEYGKNYILLQGDKKVLSRLEYSNVTNDYKRLDAIGDEEEMEIQSTDVALGLSRASASMAAPSSKTVYPKLFFDERIKDMSLDEYRIFWKEEVQHIDKNEDLLCLIKFNTEILNLYFHMPKYGKECIKTIHIDHTIEIDPYSKQ